MLYWGLEVIDMHATHPAQLTWETTKVSYAISVDPVDFLAITIAEDADLIGEESHLDTKLVRLSNVLTVDYNGHFGSAVHITIEGATVNRTQIEKVIRAHVAQCRRTLQTRRAWNRLALYQFQSAHAHGLLSESVQQKAADVDTWRRGRA